tara:strand:- start:549 stop:1388 length:840 start_codon:yes stop_codon:yes gene_type:complete
MILKSFSKINLSLNINKKLKKTKLHDIQTYFCLLNLFDLIKIKKINGSKDRIKFYGKFAKNVNLKDNSIINTFKILRNKSLVSHFYSVSINKRIPVFGGMGGGSSNAAFLARHLIKKRFNKKLLKIFDQKIGSDFKLFFHNQGFLKDLEKVVKFKKKHKFHVLLIYPYIKCSSKAVYSKVNKSVFRPKEICFRTNNTKRFIEFISKENNALEIIVKNKYKRVKTLINDISKLRGCHFSRMTGSGSVCYGIFQTKKTANAALNWIRSKYPKYWVSVAKTI